MKCIINGKIIMASEVLEGKAILVDEMIEAIVDVKDCRCGC